MNHPTKYKNIPFKIIGFYFSLSSIIKRNKELASKCRSFL